MSETPVERWRHSGENGAGARWGAFLEGIDQFDPYFFGISPREASNMDPQQRLLLEVSWEALENAGQAPTRLAGSQTGVFVGISSSDYAREQIRDGAGPPDIYSGTGNALSIAANRISYTLDLKGPSLSVDTACSSSLVAVHLAAQSLRSGESNLAIAAGANLILSPETSRVFSQAKMLAPDGKCKVFDATADGYVRGEGCGAVVMKRLSDAVANRDRICGLILATGVNQDGRTNGLTAPNGPSQRAVVSQALASAGIAPGDIGYVETHGTGTPLGDPIEVQSLAETFARRSEEEPDCWMGSVKANVGHLEPAAGIASLIKTLLTLDKETIPPQIHVRDLNPNIVLQGSRLRIPLAPTAWQRSERRRVALVESFGFGGTNGVVVLAEGPARPSGAATAAAGRHLFTLSARSERALRELAGRYADVLDATPVSLGDLCFTANTGRALFPYKLAATVSSVEELRAWLRDFLAGATVAETGWQPSEEIGQWSRVALPTYPFERERYWLEKNATRPREEAQLRPLAARRLAAAVPVFEVEISTQRMPWLDAHRYRGRAVFPAAAYLEMAIEAAMEEFGEGSFDLHQISFVRAMELEAGKSYTAQTVFTPIPGGGATFQIFTRTDESEDWTLHCAGSIQPGVPEEAAPCPQPFGNELAVAQVYRDFAANGLEYDEQFRGLRHVWQGERRTLARVELHPALAPVAGDFAIHPALLDSCLQAVGPALARGHRGTGLPVAIERLEWHGGFATQGWASAELSPRSATGMRAGVQMWDDAGRPIFAITGLRLEGAEEPGGVNENPLYELRWEAQQVPTGTARLSGLWAILPDRSGLAEELEALIRQGGGECIVHRGATEAIPANCSGVVCLAALNGGGADVFVESRTLLLDSLAAIQALVTRSTLPRLWIVTRGAASGAPAQSAVWGLGRVAALEHPAMRCALIDLDPSDKAGAAATLLAELRVSDGETQVAYRGGLRTVARIAAAEPDSEANALEVPPGESYYLRSAAPGNLQTLTLAPSVRRSPERGEVEVRVQAAGLNFSDVMKSLGVYPAPAGHELVLGAEFSGLIERIGDDVTGFSVGDRVMGIAANSFSPFVTTPDSLVVRVPHNLRMEEAATVPVAFLTAAYSLNCLAQIRKGERILIHSAAGGVGLAALQLAQLAGAEILATAGSPEKRAFLQAQGCSAIFDSRSLDFVDGVRKATGGRGVDVVLNSLAGEAMARSLDLVAPHGRFVEIGKSDIYQNRPLILTPFQRAISYFAVDLDRMFRERRDIIREMLDELAAALESGKLTPLPLRLFEMREAREAFRHMVLARHIGKVIVTPQEPARPLFHADATYLVTGGLGALGLQTAAWMADAGARNLLLIGRSSASPETETAIAGLRVRGVTVNVQQADVSDERQLRLALETLKDLRPLRGIVHAAGLLADATLARLTPERMLTVLQPKIAGAWNLHKLSLGMPLDFFMMFSSFASVVGSPGQGNYAAANAFLDGLAHYRNSIGLPGLSVNWGPWSASGMAARAQFAFDGLQPLPPARALRTLGQLLRRGASGQVVVASVDWNRLAAKLADGIPSLLGGVCTPAVKAVAAIGGGLRENLIAANGEERRESLEGHILEQVGRVSGIPIARLDRTQSLGDLGIDSLTALELANSLEQTLQVSLPLTLMSGNASVSDLAAQISDRLMA